MAKDDKRYTGTLRLELPRRDHGFLINVKDTAGNNVSLTDGEGVFVRVSEAKKTLGNGKNLLLGLNGMRLAFSLQDSEMYPGKKEAWNICDPTANQQSMPI